jgi:hypothetical protein
VDRGCLFRPVGAAGRLDLLGGGVSEDVSYAVYQESYQERVEPQSSTGGSQEGAQRRWWEFGR